MSAPSFTGSPQCAFTLTKRVSVPAAIFSRSISKAAAKISVSGAPTNVVFPPSPIHQLTAFNNDWLSHKYSNGSFISVSQSASKNAANSIRFELEPSSSRPTLHCLIFAPSQLVVSCSHFAFWIWTITCRYLALKTIASEHAYFCDHPIIVFSHFQSHLKFVFSSRYSGCFVQSCFSLVCHSAILMNPTWSILPTELVLHRPGLMKRVVWTRCGRRKSLSRFTTENRWPTSHCIHIFTLAGPFVLKAFPRWSGSVFKRLHCVLVSLSLPHSKSSISSASSSFSSLSSCFVFRMKSVMIDAKKTAVWSVYWSLHCFRLHHDSHSQIPTLAETPSAPTSARSNLIRHQWSKQLLTIFGPEFMNELIT